MLSAAGAGALLLNSPEGLKAALFVIRSGGAGKHCSKPGRVGLG